MTSPRAGSNDDATELSGRLYQSVARTLIAGIREGRHPVGTRLPAERELAAEHSVSRPTVREAIIALEVQGLVEVRVGSGVYVRRTTRPADEALSGIGAFELTEARLVFEGEAAALAATNLTDADLDTLDALVTEIDRANLEGRGEVPDRAFHLTIARGTGNAAIAKTIEDLWNLRSASPACALMFGRASAGGSKPVTAEHAAIADALRSRNPAAARAAMRAHLGRVIEHLLDATEADEIERARASVASTRNRYRRASQM